MRLIVGKRFAYLALIYILSLFSISAQSSLAEPDIESIKQVEESFRTAWLKNDEKTIMSLFTEDATMYPSTMAPVKGKSELYKFWFAPSDSVTSITAFKEKIEEINGSGNYATLIGSNELAWTTEKKDKSVIKRYLSKGYFIVVFVKQGQDWKMLKRFANGKTEEIK